METRLEIALDECISRLTKGEDLQTCLQRFPELRDELEPLLRVAIMLHSRSEETRAACAASRPALTRARARFMAEVAARQLLPPQPAARPWWQWLPRTTFAQALATLLFTLTLLGVLLAGGSIVSANSLPGDPLYGVKRASEQVRLALTTNEQVRQELIRHYEALRVQEIKQVIDQHREVQVDFRGKVDSVAGNTITVQGIPVRIDPASNPTGHPQVGDTVEIVAYTQGDGSVEAQSVAISTPMPTIEVTRIEFVQDTPTPTMPAQQRPTSTPAIAEPTHKPTTIPTWTSAPTKALTQVPTDTATALTTQTLMPSATARPSITSTPTEVVAPPREIKIRIEGLIQEMATDYWLVNGQHVTVSATTHVNQTAARAQVGAWAVVDAAKLPDGSIIAHEIVVIRGPQGAPILQEFSGTVGSVGDDRWVIAGREVLIGAQTIIDGTPQVGAIAYVKARQFSDGQLVAEYIRVSSPSEQTIQFAGVIEEIGSGHWIVAGQEVLIDPRTQIEGTPAIGTIAQVKAIVLNNGSKLAIYIRVESPTRQSTAVPPTSVQPTAAPTKTPTTAPSATPATIPTVTAVPTQAAISTATPTAEPTTEPIPSPTPIVETTPYNPPLTP